MSNFNLGSWTVGPVAKGGFPNNLRDDSVNDVMTEATEQSAAMMSTGLMFGEAFWRMTGLGATIASEFAAGATACKSPIDLVLLSMKASAQFQEQAYELAQEMLCDAHSMTRPDPRYFEAS